MADLLKLKKVVDAAVKFAKTPFEMAHELAQKRAALPVERGGLGLPPNNTAEQRAADMGFDTPAYHATDADILAFNNAKLGTNTAYLTGGDEDAIKSAMRGHWFSDRDLTNKDPRGYMFGNVSYPVKLANPKVINDQEFGSKSFIVKDPDNIRSRSAAFDPWRINAATAAAMGVAAPDLLAKEPKKKAAGGPVHMQVGGLSKIPSLVRAVGQAASKAKPFYSAVDEAIAKITQGKGTSDQFLAMIRNTPGVKPAEIADRKLGALLTGKGKMTKEQLQEIAAKNPAPQIVEREIGDKSFNARVEEITDDLVRDKIDDYESMGESPKNAAWLADSERDDLFKQAHAKVMDEGGYDPQYQRYSTPGGENYREILMKLPNKNLSTKDIAFDLYGKAMAFLTEGEKDAVHAEMRKQFDARPEFKTTHYGGDENILAHARVQDRTGPNGEKILHIEEIQSDWHQKGRKQGYKSPGDERKATSVTDEGGYYEVKDQNGKFIANVMHSDMGKDIAPENALSIANERMSSNAVGRFRDDERVPDAPFKKDWQELVLKRLVDDAARNGYHKVVITPGAEQVRRYEKAGTPEGEGLAKWYDEIIPSAVNKLYGKHGVKFGTQDIEGAEGVVPYHSFDITPQLRESIIKNGQSLYMAAPLGVAVDSALEQEAPAQQRKGGAVNQDAMNMSVWNKQLRKQHG